MRKIVLTFGLIAGAVMGASMAVTMPFHDRISAGQGMFIGYTSMVLAFLMVFFGVRACREQDGGHIGFGRALLVGLLIAGLGCACYVATWELLYYFVYPDFAERYAASAIEHARRSGADEAHLAELTRQMNEFTANYHRPLYNILMTLIEPLPVGLVFALVSAGVLRRRPAPRPMAA